MNELVAAYWPAMVAALVLGLLLAWYLFHASRKTSVTGTGGDVLDEGAAPAARNRALIDAPPAAATLDTPVIVPTPAGLAGTGVAVAAAAKSDAVGAGTGDAQADDLARLKGVGPKLVAMLHQLGVTSFDQIADWDDAEIDRIDAELGRFAGRIRRDDWVGQAKLLGTGDAAAYAARFGNVT
ncbi:hypothetical protein [Qipengyuania marisflavi]|uniref:Uncharacterized protein n=1 Tax=Qipengyuania marisflavi TaxID=2486356 RepID=A0A5S3PAE5_9SPHN|nr:hypothetical protein [Qipengyuania marisflavi]TMM50421.1 hypothetical protein FEV51_04430 [Qipengyuania marisflavi]